MPGRFCCILQSITSCTHVGTSSPGVHVWDIGLDGKWPTSLGYWQCQILEQPPTGTAGPLWDEWTGTAPRKKGRSRQNIDFLSYNTAGQRKETQNLLLAKAGNQLLFSRTQAVNGGKGFISWKCLLEVSGIGQRKEKWNISSCTDACEISSFTERAGQL